MKGIVLAGGSGTRLYPVTQCISKQLLPVYNKPLVYYPISVLMLAGIKDILIISTPKDIHRFKELLGDGSNLGINLSYSTQEKPNGLAEAFIIAEEFIQDDEVALILGDNIFYGQAFSSILKDAVNNKNCARVFGYKVKDPSNFGVVEFNSDRKVLSIEEKPLKPKSSFILTGLYFYDNRVIEIAKQLKPSQRGELEITDINKYYLNEDNLNLHILGRGFAWFDTGTHESMLEASQFIETIEKRQGFKIACLEEIAYYKNYISKSDLIKIAEPLSNSEYGKYLLELTESETIHAYWSSNYR
ncbi:MAG: glucose-1-phosphate thymidylyltransferase RfbA [Vampirovibrionia bacterium]